MAAGPERARRISALALSGESVPAFNTLPWRSDSEGAVAVEDDPATCATSCQESRGIVPRRFIAFGPIPERPGKSGTERCGSARAPVLAPGSALGSHLCGALSSVQANRLSRSESVVQLAKEDFSTTSEG